MSSAAVVINPLSVNIEVFFLVVALTFVTLTFVTGQQENGDDDLHLIAETIFNHGGWAAEHPLTHNIL